MPVITALEDQKHDPERVNVFLDGKFGFGASRLIIVARGLTQGKELTPAEIEELRRDDDVEKAYGAVLNLLSYRPRSRGELESYFRRKKVDPDVGAAAIERLQRVGLVDDDEFARFWIRNRQTLHPRGARALRAEMRGKGLSADVIDSALEALPEEEISAYEAGAQKLKSYRSLEETEFVRRMLGFLQRRGFAYSPAMAATKRLAEERGAFLADLDLPPDDGPD